MESDTRIIWATVLLYVSLISVGFIVAMVMLAIIGQIHVGKDAPAWVQAVGSIAAILVAVYVPWKQRRNALQDENKKDVARVGVMATALAPALDDTRAALITISRLIDEDYASRRGISRALLPRHPEFDQFRPDLHLLGDLAKPVSYAISRQQYFQDAIDGLASRQVLPQDFKDKLKREMASGIDAVTYARDELQKII